MLNRYWQWTSGPQTPADSGLPFGPLRFRAWTNGAAAAVASGLPFGPLRFRAWTNGLAVTPTPDQNNQQFSAPRISIEELRRRRARIIRDDQEIVDFLAVLLGSGVIR